MKSIMLLLLMITMQLQAVSDQELFLRGNQLYEQKEYVAAFDTYQEVIKKGNAVWFNMGNCAYHLHKYPQALAYWKRARHYASAQELDAIAFNIGVIDTTLGREHNEGSLLSIAERLASYLTLGQAQFLFLFSWFLLFLLWMVYNQRKRYGILVPLSVMSFFMGGLLVVKYGTSMHHYGIVLEDKVTLYAGPNNQYQVVGEIDPMVQVQVNDSKEQWCKIEHQHKVGWVPADKLMLV